MTDWSLTADQITRVQSCVPAEFRNTPQFVHPGLSRIAGRTVICKVECVNSAGSFKGRGAAVALQELKDTHQLKAGASIVAATTGNFGIALAAAVEVAGFHLTVFVPRSISRSKAAALRTRQADVRMTGDDYESARQAAVEFSQSVGAPYVADPSPGVCAAAGGIASEIGMAVSQGHLPLPADVFVPVGGGALMAGVGAWFRECLPTVRMLGVQAEAAPSIAYLWGEVQKTPPLIPTIADGLATRGTDDEVMTILRQVVDDFVLMAELDIRDAKVELSQHLAIDVEPSGAVAWAALKARKADRGPAVIIVTGAHGRSRQSTRV